jgi:chromosome segregation ATPase
METANSFILRNYKDLSTYKLCKNEISIKDPKKFGNLLRIENENLLRKLEKKDDALISLRRGYEELKINFEKKSEEVIILQNNIREKVINLQASSNQLEQTQLLVDRLEADLEAATARPSLYTSEESQKKKVEEFEILLKQKENEIVELKEELENLIRKTNAQSKNLSELSSFIDNLNDQINKKNNEVDELTVNLTLQRKKLSELNGVVENLETQLHQRDTDLENLQLCSNEKAEEIRLLNEKLQQRDEDFHNLAISRQSIKSQLRDKEIEVNEIKQLTEKFSGLTSKVKKEQLTEKEKDNLIKKEIIDLEKVSSTVTSEVEIYSFDNSSKDLVIDIFKDQQSSYEVTTSLCSILNAHKNNFF